MRVRLRGEGIAVADDLQPEGDGQPVGRAETERAPATDELIDDLTGDAGRLGQVATASTIGGDGRPQAIADGFRGMVVSGPRPGFEAQPDPEDDGQLLG